MVFGEEFKLDANKFVAGVILWVDLHDLHDPKDPKVPPNIEKLSKFFEVDR